MFGRQSLEETRLQLEGNKLYSHITTSFVIMIIVKHHLAHCRSHSCIHIVQPVL